MNPKKLVVLGSINIDHILNVLKFPNPGETLTSYNYQIAFGGKGANQAVAAGRCGANIQFIAAVGGDDLGRKIKEQLANDKIDTRAIATIKDEKTGVALIFVNKDGENEIVIYSGANTCVTPDYLMQYSNDIITADAILMQLETPISTIECAAKLAKKNNVQVILNPAPAQKLPDSLLENIDIITPNETEAEYLTNIRITNEFDANEASNILHSKGINTVIITLGSKGAWVSQLGNGQLIKGFKVNAIDTIGAGDTFNGVLATLLLEGNSLSESVKYAHAAAALSVTKSGAQPSIPTREDIDLFLAKIANKKD